MVRGEIRWYTFNARNKRRPVLILTRNSVLDYLGEVTIAPATTRVREIPSEVFLSKQDGMPKDCVINCDHIQTVSKAKIGTLIMTLGEEKLKQVSAAIAFTLDL